MTNKGRARLAAAIAWLSFIPCALLFRSLAIEDFPRRTWLAPVYLAYFATVVVWVHAFFFFLHFERKNHKGIGLSRQVPRYLDYVVTLLLTAGTLQILFAEGWLAKYIGRLSGSRVELVEKVRTQAALHVARDCNKNSYFTKDYCDQLTAIANHQNLAAYIEGTLTSDLNFLNHTIGIALAPPGGFFLLKSPIEGYVKQYAALIEYSGAKGDEDQRSAWTWLTMLLLPSVIAFRAAKTSLEVFAELS